MAAFFVRMWKEKSLGAISGIIILILILVAIFADALAPYDYLEMHLTDRLTGSSARYLLGTDQMGRDLLSRLIHGARLSLTVGLAATALNVVVATLIGGTSGFLGSRVDLVVQRLVDAWMAIPGLLVLLTIMSIVGRGLPQLIVVLGVSGGIGGSRLIRSAVIDIKESKYSVYGCGRTGHIRNGVVRNEVWEGSGGVRVAARRRAGGSWRSCGARYWNCAGRRTITAECTARR